jgi:hypothetical protein
LWGLPINTVKIKNSTIFVDDKGRLVLVTQGLIGYTLVTNKKILFRLFLDLPAVNRVSAVLATVTYKISMFNISVSKSFLVPTSYILKETSIPNGPSIGIVLTGEVFPYPSSTSITYDVEFHLLGESTFYVANFKIPELEFLMSGRLRLLIHNLVGMAPWGTKVEANFSWLIDMFQSLERFSAMLPVRDGISFGLNNQQAGLCFIYGENIDTWPNPCPSGNPPPCTSAEMVNLNLQETNQINSTGGTERVDATVSWRPRDKTKPPPPGGGEGTAGQAISYDIQPGKGLAVFVGGQDNMGREQTAPLIAQEVGHLFGLEPRASPHFEDPFDGRHSKDPGHFDPFAFDFYLLRPYLPFVPLGGFIGDPMNNTGGGRAQGRDMILYNAFDWEHLRQKFMKLPGAPRSSLDTQRKGSSKDMRKQMVTDLHATFVDNTEIQIEDLESALYSKPGHEWHWTVMGFQLVRKGKESRSRSRLTPSVEMIRSAIRELGIREAYFPVDSRPLTMVLSPNIHPSIHREAIY